MRSPIGTQSGASSGAWLQPHCHQTDLGGNKRIGEALQSHRALGPLLLIVQTKCRRPVDGPRRMVGRKVARPSRLLCLPSSGAQINVQAALPRPVPHHRDQQRLPFMIGTKRSSVHEGELAALLQCVAVAPKGVVCVIAVDREASIHLVYHVGARSRRQWVRINVPHREKRVHALPRQRDATLPPSQPVPAVPLPPGAAEWKSALGCKSTMLVHTPSHQPLGDPQRVPCNLCASPNHWADVGCTEVSKRDPPASTAKLARGTRLFLEHLGNTIIGDPAQHIRTWQIASATAHLAEVPVQGVVCAKVEELSRLDLAKRRSAHNPAGLARLPNERAPKWTVGNSSDMHRWAFRLRAAAGGSYIPQLGVILYT